MTDNRNIMRKLVDQLLAWDRSYYIENNPVVSDAVYDSVFQKLQELERMHPDLIQPDSPTQRVSGGVYKHLNPHMDVEDFQILYGISIEDLVPCESVVPIVDGSTMPEMWPANLE